MRHPVITTVLKSGLAVLLTLVAGAVMLCVVLTTSCDKEVYRHEMSRQERDEVVGCTYPGYCFSCIGMGKIECSVHLSPACPGHQHVAVEVTEYDVMYKSGKEVTEFDSKEIAEEESCHQ